METEKPKRNQDGSLDSVDADRIIKKTTERLISESRSFQKENSFRRAGTNKRDIIVKMVIYQRNTINGMVVKEDFSDGEFEKLSTDPLDNQRFKYYEHLDCEIFVRDMPMSASVQGKWLMGCFKALINYLVRMGTMDRV